MDNIQLIWILLTILIGVFIYQIAYSEGYIKGCKDTFNS